MKSELLTVLLNKPQLNKQINGFLCRSQYQEACFVHVELLTITLEDINIESGKIELSSFDKKLAEMLSAHHDIYCKEYQLKEMPSMNFNAYKYRT
jgi:hypothetical protein